MTWFNLTQVAMTYNDLATQLESSPAELEFLLAYLLSPQITKIVFKYQPFNQKRGIPYTSGPIMSTHNQLCLQDSPCIFCLDLPVATRLVNDSSLAIVWLFGRSIQTFLKTWL